MDAVKVKNGAKVKAYAGKQFKTCPKCKARGKVETRFGYRVIRGAWAAQSWCAECRKEKPAPVKAKTKPKAKAKPEPKAKPKAKAEPKAAKAEPKAPAPAPVNGVELSVDRVSTKALYAATYPNDTDTNRSWGYMAKKLVRKLGSDILTPAARMKFLGEESVI